MGFADDIREFSKTVETDSQALFVNIASAVQASIQFGSPVTGAPGQPVQTANLRDSWILEFPSRDQAQISTNVVYAPDIEEGVRTARSGQVTGHTKQRLMLRSPVGGFHSVRKTLDAFDALVDDETQKFGSGR